MNANGTVDEHQQRILQRVEGRVEEEENQTRLIGTISHSRFCSSFS